MLHVSVEDDQPVTSHKNIGGQQRLAPGTASRPVKEYLPNSN